MTKKTHHGKKRNETNTILSPLKIPEARGFELICGPHDATLSVKRMTSGTGLTGEFPLGERPHSRV
jgi:hypothetical protein